MKIPQEIVARIDLVLVDPRRDLCLRRDAGYVGQHHAMALGSAADAGDFDCSFGCHVLVNVENARKFAAFLCKQCL